MLKIVLHLDKSEKWLTLSTNVKNVESSPVETDVYVVVNGLAVRTFLQADVRRFIQQHPQVHFEACKNALDAHHVSVADLIPEIKVVPNGVIEIAQLEAKGFGYIKP
ncbi:hypothetical protein IV38_GL000056 [Lactobacillus selangorensis]|uniref:Uncharacterized protein n=1 Tax=Lactobacillus selangorensis TaxID=81857 RepID=A0A0R2FSM0_9LACO|nr:DsrE family protein [Lactobacillus selangorensis]KRN29177.1 hypothetical protein IV38_GL000056 [Lactobacillus selangorensis]KRN31465.1 hypothetical protein IV40_GL001462 [Lactobacillus selangorensis]